MNTFLWTALAALAVVCFFAIVGTLIFFSVIWVMGLCFKADATNGDHQP